MANLTVEAIATATVPRPSYHPADDYALDPLLREYAEVVCQYVADNWEADPRVGFLPDTPENGVTRLALDWLGPSPAPQPLYLVRSDGDLDPFVASLPRLTSGREWITDELTLSHLAASAGTAAFDFLRWSITDAGATVLFVDQPPVCLLDSPPERVSAVALRCSTGTGGARVVAHGQEGAPQAVEAQASHVFSGTGPCDTWRALAQAVADRRVHDDDCVLLRFRGSTSEGWLVLDIRDAAALTARSDTTEPDERHATAALDEPVLPRH
ncbi:hypothetical protein [Streptomyces sp. NBC_01092]|uniref:hypothetical protein n=1 Tax=Streptomyces sp. NBC_01092 TaxID=2903748 RepID=UPI0038691C6E|nr:hypothetical protein OG254_49100 [Streptomyces sp. NBC_01092]